MTLSFFLLYSILHFDSIFYNVELKKNRCCTFFLSKCDNDIKLQTCFCLIDSNAVMCPTYVFSRRRCWRWCIEEIKVMRAVIDWSFKEHVTYFSSSFLFARLILFFSLLWEPYILLWKWNNFVLKWTVVRFSKYLLCIVYWGKRYILLYTY